MEARKNKKYDPLYLTIRASNIVKSINISERQPRFLRRGGMLSFEKIRESNVQL